MNQSFLMIHYFLKFQMFLLFLMSLSFLMNLTTQSFLKSQSFLTPRRSPVSDSVAAASTRASPGRATAAACSLVSGMSGGATSEF